jgi:hypothetical protein
MTKHIPVELVTPKMAEAWLDKNTNNRSLREGVVEKYAHDMKHGNWTHCTAPIAFYEDGSIADGQHRLFAVVESGESQEFIIVRGLNKRDGLNIDRGVPRTIIDGGRISGADPELTKQMVAVCKGIQLGEHAKRTLSDTDQLAMVDKHREAAQFAMRVVRHFRYLGAAPFTCAVARAWYLEPDKAKLERFAHVYSTGFYDGTDKESAAIALRNYALMKGRLLSQSSEWRDTFLKAQNAISYFMRGKKLSMIKTVSDETYPLKKGKK